MRFVVADVGQVEITVLAGDDPAIVLLVKAMRFGGRLAQHDGVKRKDGYHDRTLAPAFLVKRRHAPGDLIVQSRRGAATPWAVSYEQAWRSRPQGVDCCEIGPCRIPGSQLVDRRRTTWHGCL